MDISVKAGYSNYNLILPNPAFPILDSAIGFTFSFQMQLNSESHSGNDNRAGFSVILLDKDNQGVELGFWTDSI